MQVIDKRALQIIMELDKATKWRAVNTDGKLVELVSWLDLLPYKSFKE